ncbi:unnamed protein product [Rotaria magnacalcarata]|uniref:MULE transposase domain-containing protein n=1 Tax=Rotaria magnacalcarata TaxID=392030 RepID=A0A816Q582_9BILA|nr:unnamed protein product [Rotaria magnacalcarata]
MMMTRSRIVAATTADATTLLNSNPMVIVHKQTQSQSHHILRSKKRSPIYSPVTSGRRSRSQAVKRTCNKNDNVGGTDLFVLSKSTTRSHSSSSNSSSSSGSSSSRSSSSSSTLSLLSSSSSSTSSTSLVTEEFSKLQINTNTDSSSSSKSTIVIPLTQEIDRLPQPGSLDAYRSNKNSVNLCLHGYSYEYVTTMKYKKIKWRCKEIRRAAKCGSKIYTGSNLGTDKMPVYQYIGSNNVCHSHDPDFDKQKLAIFNYQLKNTAESNKSIPPSKLINQLTTDMKLNDKQITMIPKVQTLCRKVHRARSRTLPCIPRSLIFDIPDNFSFTSSGEKFIVFDHLYLNRTKRIIGFASPLQLRKLFSSPLICLDGTFPIVPKCYKQLLIIQSIDATSYEATPVLYALLNDKKTYTYTLIFQALKRTAKQMQMKFSPNRIITDFEKSMITTVRKQLPTTIHQGCLFHLYQAMSKKMKRFNLWTYYKSDDNLHLFLKKVMAIVLLIPSLMDNAFELLQKEYLKNKKLKRFKESLTKFMMYVNKQWLKSDMRTMITFYEVKFKTNNWSESYNSALRRRGQQNHLSIWLFIQLLIFEETAVRMKHFHTLNGKINAVNKSVRDGVLHINQKIIEINKQLTDNEIRLDDSLIALSALFGLKYEKWRRERKKNKKRIKDDNVDDDLLVDNFIYS